MVNWSMKKSYNCRDLAEIVRILRHPGGCPWDQEQTHASIRRNFLEEAYEVAEAIDKGDVDGLREELGDVLLQVYFHTSIEEDAGRFTLDSTLMWIYVLVFSSTPLTTVSIFIPTACGFYYNSFVVW